MKCAIKSPRMLQLVYIVAQNCPMPTDLRVQKSMTRTTFEFVARSTPACARHLPM